MCVIALGGGMSGAWRDAQFQRLMKLSRNNVTLVINQQMSTRLNQFLTTGPFRRDLGFGLNLNCNPFSGDILHG
jgi:hypothetical protein